MSDSLIWGLRNAIERGYSLEQAARSYISAGYTEVEVSEALRSLTSESGSLMTNPENKNPVLVKKEEVKAIPKIPIQSAQPILASNISKYPSIPSPAPGMIVKKPILASYSSPLNISPTSQIIAQQKQYAPIIPNPPINLPLVEKQNSQPSGNRKTLIIFLIFLLIVLILGLIGIFVFSEQILKLLSGGA